MISWSVLFKNWITAFKIKVTAKVQNVSECLSGCYELQIILVPNLMYGDAASCARVSCRKLVHCLQCQGHSEGLYNQNMTISTLSSKLLVCLQPNLVFIVQHHKPECSFQKLGYCSRSRSQQSFKMLVNVCPDVFWTADVCVNLMYGNAASWARVMQKNLLAVFNVKVTARAYIIKIWLFLLNLLLLVHLQTNLV